MKIESWMVMEIIFYAMVASAGVLFTVLAIYIPKFFEVYEKDKLGEYEVDEKESAGFKAHLDISSDKIGYPKEFREQLKRGERCSKCAHFNKITMLCDDVQKGFPKYFVSKPEESVCANFKVHPMREDVDCDSLAPSPEINCTTCSHFDKIRRECEYSIFCCTENKPEETVCNVYEKGD